jgi:hypothetical protein
MFLILTLRVFFFYFSSLNVLIKLKCRMICFSRRDNPDVFQLIHNFYCHIVVLGVHCDIYKSPYNISLLNTPSPSFSSIPFFPHSWNNFNMSHFSIFIQEYIIFLLHWKQFLIEVDILRTCFKSFDYIFWYYFLSYLIILHI